MNNIQVTLMGKSNCNTTASYKENYVIQVVCLNMCQAILSDAPFNNNINSSCIKAPWYERKNIKMCECMSYLPIQHTISRENPTKMTICLRQLWSLNEVKDDQDNYWVKV